MIFTMCKLNSHTCINIIIIDKNQDWAGGDSLLSEWGLTVK